MTVFTEGQMHRALFEPLAGNAVDDAREVFRFGRNRPRHLSDLGQEYYNAAYLLVEWQLRQPENHVGKIANPALFLYRHSIELFLKAIIPADRRQPNHNLVQLSETFRQLVREQFVADVPEWVMARLDEMAAADPRSTAFRYHDAPGIATGEPMTVDCEHLQSAMVALNCALVGVIAAIAIGEGADDLGEV